MATFIFDPICDSSWVANTLTWLWGKIPWEDDRRKSTERFWKETWKLKDAKQLTEWEKSCNILFGMEPTSSEMNLSYMPNYKGSVDFMFEKQNPTQFFAPTGTFSASIPMKVVGLHASYRCMHPKEEPDQLELRYEGLEHWLFKLKLPLSLTERPTIFFSVTPNYETFSLPCEIKLEGNLDKRIPDCRIANWSIGLKRDASIISFALKISQSITETKSTASCKAKIHGLSASADWNGEDLKCSFEQEDQKFSITSKCQINVKDAKKNVCSVGVGKRWDDDEKGLHRGIQVVFDTHNVAAITYSRSLTKKLSLELSAKVDARVINDSQLRANFSFT